MPKSQKKSKKTKAPKKQKIESQISLDDIEESILLGDDDITQLPPNSASKSRKTSLETSLLEDELLGETTPLAIKKSKRRKTRSSKSERVTLISEMNVSLNISQSEEILLHQQVSEDKGSIDDDIDDVFNNNLSEIAIPTDKPSSKDIKIKKDTHKEILSIVNSTQEAFIEPTISNSSTHFELSPLKSCTKTNPSRTVPVKVPAVKTSAKTSPVKILPVKPIPAKISPAKISPAKISPAKISPAKISVVETNPVELSPVKTSVKMSPVKTSPVKTSPVKISPVKTSPVKTSSVKISPVKTSPVKTSPVKTLDLQAEITPTYSTTAAGKEVELDEVDIYSDLSNDNVDTTSHTPEGFSEEVTFDEVFKMNAKPAACNSKKSEIIPEPVSDNEDDDLDYEEDVSQMKISVLVGGSKNKKSPVRESRDTISDVRGHVRGSHVRGGPLSLPPLPHTHITIPPMLPLPPAPPQYHPTTKTNPNKRGSRTVYINPKFRTEVILRNLEAQGVVKGGSVAVHMNRNMHRPRSRSPIKIHSAFEYVPSPVQKQKVELDDPTTTLLLTDLSVCTTRSRIKELFSSVGNVKEVLTYPAERRAVVTFQHAKDAVVCRRKFHRSIVDGSCMTVNFAI